MSIKTVSLLCNVVLVLGYNVDTDHAVVYETTANDYFGYSVLLHHDNEHGKSRLIVGAPRGNYSFNDGRSRRPGVVYNCLIDGACNSILPGKGTKPEDEIYVEKLEMKVAIEKENGWFGSTMSVDRSSGLLTVCAPRTVVNIFNPFRNEYIDTMHGICYSNPVSSSSLSIEAAELSAYDFSTSFWYNPLHGFSLHYATVKQNHAVASRAIGEPNHELYGTVNVQRSLKQSSAVLPDSDDLSHFGYSATSGYFFKENQLLYAAGAPGSQYVGQVAIIEPLSSPSILSSVRGNEIGEFFGASLASGDLNGDGLDDLVVGAPYWGHDSGKVYLLLGNEKGQLAVTTYVEGSVQGSHFGYALACGDLDSDGLADIIVGAPWEERGAIYIYSGAASLKDGKTIGLSQRIAVADLAHSAGGIERFGFSISEPVDIDQNGYPDIAVGAYKSGHAVLLRSKPVVETQLVIKTVPSILRRDAKVFSVEVCTTHRGNYMRNTQEFKITITVDEQYQRASETTLELRSSESDSNACVRTNVKILQEEIRDFIEPIELVARHDFLYDNESSAFCKSCPVEIKRNELRVARALLPFDIGCGEDTVCNSNISATAVFYDVRDNDTWVVGSNDISLEVSLRNGGEPAYLTSLVFMIPEGIILRSLLPLCQEITTADELLVVCDLGNPLAESEERAVKLDLDMRCLNRGSLQNSTLDFHVEIKTRSRNHGTTNLTKTISLVSEVSLSLNGKAKDESYYLPVLKENTSDVRFQHTYQVYKLGPTPVEEAKLIIKVPISLGNLNPIVHVYEPKMYILGEIYKCTSIDSVLLETRTNEVQEETLYDQFNLNARTKQDNVKTPARKRRAVKERKPIAGEQDSITSTAQEQLFNVTEIIAGKSDFVERNIIYMNCSSRDVNCSTIFCDLSGLKTLQDVAKIPVKLVLDVGQLRDSFSRGRQILKFVTEARVEMLKPTESLSIDEPRYTMEVTTLFYNTPKMQELQLWIILVSVTVGLLLLCVFIVILRTLGFFKRSGKQNLTSLKSSEVTDEESKGSAGISKAENA